MIKTKIIFLVIVFLLAGMIFSTIAMGLEEGELEEGQFLVDCDTLVPIDPNYRTKYAGQQITLVYEVNIPAPPMIDQYNPVEKIDYCVGMVDPGDTPPGTPPDPPIYRQTLPRTGISIALILGFGAVGIGAARYFLKTSK